MILLTQVEIFNTFTDRSVHLHKWSIAQLEGGRIQGFACCRKQQIQCDWNRDKTWRQCLRQAWGERKIKCIRPKKNL